MLKIIKSFLMTSMIASALFIVLGFCFVLNPAGSFDVVSKIIAILLISVGVFGVFAAFSNPKVSFSLSVVMSVLALIGGIVIFANPGVIKYILAISLGVYFIASGLVKVRYANALRTTDTPWMIPFIAAVLSIVCGVISIFCPFAFADAATIAIGIVMIVYAFSDFINAALLQRDIDTISDFFEEHSHKKPAKKSSDKKKEPKRIKEAEVVEKDDEK